MSYYNLFLDHITQTTHFSLEFALNRISLFIIFHVSNNAVIDPTTTKIWIHLPFLGKYGTKLTNNFIRKISPLLKSPCKFIVNWKTTDTNCFISLKDPTPKTYQSSVQWRRQPFKCGGDFRAVKAPDTSRGVRGHAPPENF